MQLTSQLFNLINRLTVIYFFHENLKIIIIIPEIRLGRMTIEIHHHRSSRVDFRNLHLKHIYEEFRRLQFEFFRRFNYLERVRIDVPREHTIGDVNFRFRLRFT